VETPDEISEAKIMRRMDTLQDDNVDVESQAIGQENLKVEIGSSSENNNLVENVPAKDLTPEVGTSIETDNSTNEVLPINGADIQIKVDMVTDAEPTQQKTKPSSPKKRSNSNKRRANKQQQEEVLSNYDIIDRTEAKKLQAQQNVLSFANVFGRFKKAFSSPEAPKRLLVDDDSHPFVQSSVVNLSIAQTENGEQMQVSLPICFVRKRNFNDRLLKVKLIFLHPDCTTLHKIYISGNIEKKIY